MIDWEGSIGAQKLQERCAHYAKELGKAQVNLVRGSDSDLH